MLGLLRVMCLCNTVVHQVLSFVVSMSFYAVASCSASSVWRHSFIASDLVRAAWSAYPPYVTVSDDTDSTNSCKLCAADNLLQNGAEKGSHERPDALQLAKRKKKKNLALLLVNCQRC